jgi:hypothetical protein
MVHLLPPKSKAGTPRRIPRPKMARKLADALGVEPADLYR